MNSGSQSLAAGANSSSFWFAAATTKRQSGVVNDADGAFHCVFHTASPLARASMGRKRSECEAFVAPLRAAAGGAPSSSPRKAGEGLFGWLLNSGWNCVQRKNGCCSCSTTVTIPSADLPVTSSPVGSCDRDSSTAVEGGEMR